MELLQKNDIISDQKKINKSDLLNHINHLREFENVEQVFIFNIKEYFDFIMNYIKFSNSNKDNTCNSFDFNIFKELLIKNKNSTIDFNTALNLVSYLNTNNQLCDLIEDDLMCDDCEVEEFESKEMELILPSIKYDKKLN